jgi:hypothetical protein
MITSDMCWIHSDLYLWWGIELGEAPQPPEGGAEV